MYIEEQLYIAGDWEIKQGGFVIFSDRKSVIAQYNFESLKETMFIQWAGEKGEQVMKTNEHAQPVVYWRLKEVVQG